jgi:hypothetical protein
MKFVILSNKIIPDFNVKGPVLTPMEYDIHQVLRWLTSGIDVREVMEDGSYRKLSFNDAKLVDELYNKSNKNREKIKKEQMVKKELKPNGNVRLKPEKTKKVAKPIEQPPKVKEKKVEEEPINVLIDELEKPE